MRWDNLFDDLESQLESELSAEEIDLQAEEERLRLGRMSIRDRLAAICQAHSQAHSQGERSPIRVLLADGESVRLHPAALGKDWLSGDIADDASRRNQCIIPLASVSGLVLDPAQSVASLASVPGETPPRELSSRLSLAFVLRDLCRRRHGVDLVLVVGTVHGTIDRVGRDHLDLAVHERGVPRRASAVNQLRIIPLSQITLVRL